MKGYRNEAGNKYDRKTKHRIKRNCCSFKLTTNPKLFVTNYLNHDDVEVITKLDLKKPLELNNNMISCHKHTGTYRDYLTTNKILVT